MCAETWSGLHINLLASSSLIRIIVYPRIDIYVHHLCTMHYTIQLHTHNTSNGIKLHWNLSITDTLGHLSNEDTICRSNHIELCTNLGAHFIQNSQQGPNGVLYRKVPWHFKVL